MQWRSRIGRKGGNITEGTSVSISLIQSAGRNTAAEQPQIGKEYGCGGLHTERRFPVCDVAKHIPPHLISTISSHAIRTSHLEPRPTVVMQKIASYEKLPNVLFFAQTVIAKSIQSKAVASSNPATAPKVRRSSLRKGLHPFVKVVNASSDLTSALQLGKMIAYEIVLPGRYWPFGGIRVVAR